MIFKYLYVFLLFQKLFFETEVASRLQKLIFNLSLKLRPGIG